MTGSFPVTISMFPSLLLLLGSVSCSGAIPAEFSAPDERGVVRRWEEWRDQDVVVLVFLKTSCPLSQVYAVRLAELSEEFAPRGVQFVGVCPSAEDDAEAVADFVKRRPLGFPLLRDEGGKLAAAVGAERVPEAIVLDRQREVRYHGRIDDQYAVDGRKPAPTQRDLASALEDVLAGNPVSRPRVPGTGCLLASSAAKETVVAYSSGVAEIFSRRCVTCHRPGEAAPFSLATLDEIRGWEPMIREVVSQGRMPPWHASADYGRFANDLRLTGAEKTLLLAWLDGGAPAGDPVAPIPLPPRTEWSIGEPDVVLDMGTTFDVPADGVIDYQYFRVDPGFTTDRWVRAAEVLPGARAAVHHCIVFVEPPGVKGPGTVGDLGSVWLAATAPGMPALHLPAGMAKRVPAGSTLIFQLHYATTGEPHADRTRLGLKFAEPDDVRQEVATQMIFDMSLKIPPHDPAFRFESRYVAAEDLWLLSLYPHMHSRGKSFRYEAIHPDGAVEVLLDIPRYDFNWQNIYVLAEPKRLAKGTVVRCSAVFDNSAANPANPDPSREVPWGEQTYDEMMIGYMDVTPVDRDPRQAPSVGERIARGWRFASSRLFSLRGLAISLALGLFTLHFLRWRRENRTPFPSSASPTT